MAGFEPEHGDLLDLVEQIARQAALTFQDAETRLLAEIARRLLRDMPPLAELAEQLRIIQDLEDFARQITAGITRDLAAEFVAHASTSGAAAAIKHLSWLPSIPQVSMLTQSHVLAAALVAADLGNAFSDMTARILRYPRDAVGQFLVGGDVYQRVIANNVPSVMLGSSTAAARKAATREFLERGVTGFTDVAGRNWRIGTYAEMATRTAAARAYRDAYDFRVGELGLDLFTVLGGRNACPACAQWFGKVLSSTGAPGPRLVQHATEDRFISVDVAATVAQWRASGAGHPSCTCERVVYLPGLSAATSAEHYDPAAHRARDQLRALERSERDAKRKLAIATALGDDVDAARWRREVLTIQAETRAHIAATGQRRRYDRAQIRFADGA